MYVKTYVIYIVQLRTIIDYDTPTSQLFVDRLPTREISNCKHVALRRTTTEHVLHGNLQSYNLSQMKLFVPWLF